MSIAPLLGGERGSVLLLLLLDVEEDDADLTLLVAVETTETGGTTMGLDFSGDPPFRNDGDGGTPLFVFPSENRCANSFFLRSTSANIASMLLLTLLLLLLGATSKEFPAVLLGKVDRSVVVVVVCRKKNPISRITNAAMNTAVAFSWLKGDGVRLSLSVSSVFASLSAATDNRCCFDFLTFVLRIVR